MFRTANGTQARKYAKMQARINGHVPGYFRRRWTGTKYPILYCQCKRCGAYMEIREAVEVSGAMVESVCPKPVENSQESNIETGLHI